MLKTAAAAARVSLFDVMGNLSSENYFDLFQLPTQYGIDKQQLSERYRALQRVAHPDRHAHASAQQGRLAQQKATLINDAYHVLKNDLRRAQHLLQLKGAPYEGHTISDPMFLMEQMALREELEGVAASKDIDRLNQFFSKAQQLQRECESALQQAFSGQNYQAASDEVVKLQFISKLCEEAELLEENLL